ncbi:UNVERIFIED_CONTAM: hypothetical protein Sradi_0881400 [Sesamum radiatum]|uniref:DUF4283 domain-containing protein n=1 Tax=Sesamum radiatum TaxID=300843 RepID=A0AAW2V520_SESRA
MGSVEEDLERLSKGLKLTDEEEDGIIVPNGLWEANTISVEWCLVGRLLSNKPVRFEEVCSSLQSMLLPAKGMEIKKLEDGRFLLCFQHVIDKTHALEGFPWCFEKNLIILSTIAELENPMQVALELQPPIEGELLVRFPYERPPNFCYLYGHLRHFDKYCETCFVAGFQDKKEPTPYGPWLRAPTLGKGQAVSMGLRPLMHSRQQCVRIADLEAN